LRRNKLREKTGESEIKGRNRKKRETKKKEMDT
jgi:hypothetical protein